MTYLGTTLVADPICDIIPMPNRTMAVHHTVLVLTDNGRHNEFLDAICDFLDIGIEYASSDDDLSKLLVGTHPMAVVADLEGEVQDGCHVMKIVGECDRSLPILLLGSNDPALLGAVDAVREIWGLGRVEVVTGAAGIGSLVDFICQAARDAGRSRLMRS